MVLRSLLLPILLTKCLEVVAQPQLSNEIRSTGTGFAVSSEGHLITNEHVVQDCLSVRAIGLDGNRYDVMIVARDARNDLALLKAPLANRAFAVFRRSPIRSGDDVTALGFPYSGLLASDVNVSAGIVSAMAGVLNDTSKIQISAPVQPGNSGGPLLDSTGALAGVVVSRLNALAFAKATGGDIPQNVNFGIKSEIVQSFLTSNGVEPRVGIDNRPKLPLATVVQQSRPYIYLIQCLAVQKQVAATDGRNATSQQTPRQDSSDSNRARGLGPQETKEALDRISQESREACARTDYAIIYAKTACREEDITLDQLSDTSMITAAEMPAFTSAHNESKARRKNVKAVFRSSAHPNRSALVELTEMTGVSADANSLALYERSITWGQYNKRKKEITLTYRDEMKRLWRSSGTSAASSRTIRFYNGATVTIAGTEPYCQVVGAGASCSYRTYADCRKVTHPSPTDYCASLESLEARAIR